MFFQQSKIAIPRSLRERIKQAAQVAGYSSTDEFVVHALEQAVQQIEQRTEQAAADRELLDRQLRGLGYLE